LKPAASASKQRKSISKIDYKDRGRSFNYKIIPNTKLKYSMYQNIKQMIKNSSLHDH